MGKLLYTLIYLLFNKTDLEKRRGALSSITQSSAEPVRVFQI